MSEANVKKIYNVLSKVESQLHQATAYPIHKKLDFNDPAIPDLYDWIFKNIDLPKEGKILDVGCGVGYGSFYLAEKTNCSTLGISLSENEISLAKTIAENKNLSDRCQFKVQSFDKPLTEKFDLMIAVESIKHTVDLRTTLNNLLSALKENGKLIIVEDVFTDKLNNKYVSQLKKDWILQEIYDEADYQNSVANFSVNWNRYDLTKFMHEKSDLHLSFQYLSSSLIGNLFSKTSKGQLMQIIRGGYALEKLYKRQVVQYQVLEATLS